MKRNSRSASGFTLIEMLVVVLVIGVLVSFAWPEYQAAMARTRMASLIPMLRTLKDDMEMRLLTDGSYPDASDGDVSLDIEMFDSCTGMNEDGYIECPKEVYFDICRGNQFTVGAIDGKNQLAYLLWLDRSAHPNEKRCLANKDNAIANKVCKNLEGEVVDEDYGEMTLLGGESNYIVYRI